MLDDNVGIKMRYPDISKIDSDMGDNFETVMKMVKDSIDMIFTSEETHERDTISGKELEEFIDQLNTDQFNNIVEFFNTMPKLRHVVQITNPKTKVKSEVVLEGLQNFLE